MEHSPLARCRALWPWTARESSYQAVASAATERRDFKTVAAVSGAGLLLAGFLAALAIFRPAAHTRPSLRGLEEVVQHVYIIRHGDKYSSYPDCPGKPGQLCFDADRMGDNPPLTPCGIKQAEHTAKWLQDQEKADGNIRNIVVSPFTRTLQTALPLAKALGKNLRVEYSLSEANQQEGPYREHNVEEPAPTAAQLREIRDLWDLDYGSPPIPTPEDNGLYVLRVAEAVKVLKRRFPPSSGNLAVYTHATTSFSIAYGLCYAATGSDLRLQEFVEGQEAIGPGGVIHLTISADGKCTKVGQTQNIAEGVCDSNTNPFKCTFADFPSWYWAHADGKGRGRCH